MGDDSPPIADLLNDSWQWVILSLSPFTKGELEGVVFAAVRTPPNLPLVRGGVRHRIVSSADALSAG